MKFYRWVESGPKTNHSNQWDFGSDSVQNLGCSVSESGYGSQYTRLLYWLYYIVFTRWQHQSRRSFLMSQRCADFLAFLICFSRGPFSFSLPKCRRVCVCCRSGGMSDCDGTPQITAAWRRFACRAKDSGCQTSSSITGKTVHSI